jgi:hypothetical protein
MKNTKYERGSGRHIIGRRFEWVTFAWLLISFSLIWLVRPKFRSELYCIMGRTGRTPLTLLRIASKHISYRDMPLVTPGVMVAGGAFCLIPYGITGMAVGACVALFLLALLPVVAPVPSTFID